MIIILHRGLWEGLKVITLLISRFFGITGLIYFTYFNSSRRSRNVPFKKLTIKTYRKECIRGLHTNNQGPFIWVYDITKFSDNHSCLVEGAPFKTNFSQLQKVAYSTDTTPSYKWVKKYENMDTQKLQILDENKGKPGVYLIRNLKNNKFYVGSSIDIRRRFKEYFSIDHLLRRNKLPICAALSKYGYSLFSVEILEYCDTPILLIFLYIKKMPQGAKENSII